MSETSDTKPETRPAKNGPKSNPRGDRERSYVKEIVDATTRIGVRIQRTQAFRPYYNLCIGRFVEHDMGETFVPYIPVRAETEHAKVKSLQNHSKLLADMIQEATDWIAAELQKREDEIIETQMKREQRQLDRDKPSQKPGIKTLGKIDRAIKNYGGTE